MTKPRLVLARGVRSFRSFRISLLYRQSPAFLLSLLFLLSLVLSNFSIFSRRKEETQISFVCALTRHPIRLHQRPSSPAGGGCGRTGRGEACGRLSSSSSCSPPPRLTIVPASRSPKKLAVSPPSSASSSESAQPSVSCFLSPRSLFFSSFCSHEFSSLSLPPLALGGAGDDSSVRSCFHHSSSLSPSSLSSSLFSSFSSSPHPLPSACALSSSSSSFFGSFVKGHDDADDVQGTCSYCFLSPASIQEPPRSLAKRLKKSSSSLRLFISPLELPRLLQRKREGDSASLDRGSRVLQSSPVLEPSPQFPSSLSSPRASLFSSSLSSPSLPSSSSASVSSLYFLFQGVSRSTPSPRYHRATGSRGDGRAEEHPDEEEKEEKRGAPVERGEGLSVDTAERPFSSSSSSPSLPPDLQGNLRDVDVKAGFQMQDASPSVFSARPPSQGGGFDEGSATASKEGRRTADAGGGGGGEGEEDLSSFASSSSSFAKRAPQREGQLYAPAPPSLDEGEKYFFSPGEERETEDEEKVPWRSSREGRDLSLGQSAERNSADTLAPSSPYPLHGREQTNRHAFLTRTTPRRYDSRRSYPWSSSFSSNEYGLAGREERGGEEEDLFSPSSFLPSRHASPDSWDGDHEAGRSLSGARGGWAEGEGEGRLRPLSSSPIGGAGRTRSVGPQPFVSGEAGGPRGDIRRDGTTPPGEEPGEARESSSSSGIASGVQTPPVRPRGVAGRWTGLAGRGSSFFPSSFSRASFASASFQPHARRGHFPPNKEGAEEDPAHPPLNDERHAFRRSVSSRRLPRRDFPEGERYQGESFYPDERREAHGEFSPTLRSYTGDSQEMWGADRTRSFNTRRPFPRDRGEFSSPTVSKPVGRSFSSAPRPREGRIWREGWEGQGGVVSPSSQGDASWGQQHSVSREVREQEGGAEFTYERIGGEGEEGIWDTRGQLVGGNREEEEEETGRRRGRVSRARLYGSGPASLLYAGEGDSSRLPLERANSRIRAESPPHDLNESSGHGRYRQLFSPPSLYESRRSRGGFVGGGTRDFLRDEGRSRTAGGRGMWGGEGVRGEWEEGEGGGGGRGSPIGPMREVYRPEGGGGRRSRISGPSQTSPTMPASWDDSRSLVNAEDSFVQEEEPFFSGRVRGEGELKGRDFLRRDLFQRSTPFAMRGRRNIYPFRGFRRIRGRSSSFFFPPRSYDWETESRRPYRHPLFSSWPRRGGTLLTGAMSRGYRGGKRTVGRARGWSWGGRREGEPAKIPPIPSLPVLLRSLDVGLLLCGRRRSLDCIDSSSPDVDGVPAVYPAQAGQEETRLESSPRAGSEETLQERRKGRRGGEGGGRRETEVGGAREEEELSSAGLQMAMEEEFPLELDEESVGDFIDDRMRRRLLFLPPAESLSAGAGAAAVECDPDGASPLFGDEAPWEKRGQREEEGEEARQSPERSRLGPAENPDKRKQLRDPPERRRKWFSFKQVYQEALEKLTKGRSIRSEQGEEEEEEEGEGGEEEEQGTEDGLETDDRLDQLHAHAAFARRALAARQRRKATLDAALRRHNIPPNPASWMARAFVYFNRFQMKSVLFALWKDYVLRNFFRIHRNSAGRTRPPAERYLSLVSSSSSSLSPPSASTQSRVCITEKKEASGTERDTKEGDGAFSGSTEKQKDEGTKLMENGDNPVEEQRGEERQREKETEEEEGEREEERGGECDEAEKANEDYVGIEEDWSAYVQRVYGVNLRQNRTLELPLLLAKHIFFTQRYMAFTNLFRDLRFRFLSRRRWEQMEETSPGLAGKPVDSCPGSNQEVTEEEEEEEDEEFGDRDGGNFGASGGGEQRRQEEEEGGVFSHQETQDRETRDEEEEEQGNALTRRDASSRVQAVKDTDADRPELERQGLSSSLDSSTSPDGKGGEEEARERGAEESSAATGGTECGLSSSSFEKNRNLSERKEEEKERKEREAGEESGEEMPQTALSEEKSEGQGGGSFVEDRGASPQRDKNREERSSRNEQMNKLKKEETGDQGEKKTAVERVGEGAAEDERREGGGKEGGEGSAEEESGRVVAAEANDDAGEISSREGRGKERAEDQPSTERPGKDVGAHSDTVRSGRRAREKEEEEEEEEKKVNGNRKTESYYSDEPKDGEASMPFHDSFSSPMAPPLPSSSSSSWSVSSSPSSPTSNTSRGGQEHARGEEQQGPDEEEEEKEGSLSKPHSRRRRGKGGEGKRRSSSSTSSTSASLVSSGESSLDGSSVSARSSSGFETEGERETSSEEEPSVALQKEKEQEEEAEEGGDSAREIGREEEKAEETKAEKQADSGGWEERESNLSRELETLEVFDLLPPESRV